MHATDEPALPGADEHDEFRPAAGHADADGVTKPLNSRRESGRRGEGWTDELRIENCKMRLINCLALLSAGAGQVLAATCTWQAWQRRQMVQLPPTGRGGPLGALIRRSSTRQETLACAIDVPSQSQVLPHQLHQHSHYSASAHVLGSFRQDSGTSWHRGLTQSHLPEFTLRNTGRFHFHGRYTENHRFRAM